MLLEPMHERRASMSATHAAPERTRSPSIFKAKLRNGRSRACVAQKAMPSSFHPRATMRAWAAGSHE